MEDLLDQTTLSTLSLMESRLKRIEHLLYGQATSASRTHDTPAARRIRDLERALASLLSEYRVYSDILKIRRSCPALSHSPHPTDEQQTRNSPTSFTNQRQGSLPPSSTLTVCEPSF